MAIQCGLVAAGALGILMLIIIARSRLFTWFTDGGQHNIMSMIDPKCSSPMIDGSGSRSSRDWRMATVKGEVKGGEEKQFELLLVLMNDLEEPSDQVWL
jgi:hypothetical protein